MLGITGFPVFLGAIMLLNFTPGPDMAYVTGQSMASGRQAGLLSALGVALGGCLHTLACAFGLSALIAASPEKTLALLVLGTVLVLSGLFSDCILACFAARMASSLKKRAGLSRWINRVVGATFVGMAVRLAAIR